MSNIEAAKTVADVIRTCLGPKAMLKMLMDPMGGIVVTNDGNAILREIDVAHPVAKSLLELSRAQDEEVGDGTTSVIILAGEVLAAAVPFLERKMHPIIIISAFRRALEDGLKALEAVSIPVNVASDEEMLRIVRSCLKTKLADRWSDLLCGIALGAVRCVAVPQNAAGKRMFEVDTKRYVRVEKIPGGEIEESRLLDGIVLNKDVTHPNMRRRIENPRIVLLDAPLEYRKGESQMNIEITKEEDWAKVLDLEEAQIRLLCEQIIALKPDLVITEKGISDLAQHFLVKAGISAIRRVRKSDNNRLARACGATIVTRLEDIRESDVGTAAGLFEISKIGDEYFTFVTGCRDPKACTILLRGASKDVLNELERNLHDAMGVARNVYMDGRLCPGGGAAEMAVSAALERHAKTMEGVEKGPYRAIAAALEVIPRTLVQNCGADPIRLLTDLRAKHAAGPCAWGIDGIYGRLAEMTTTSGTSIWEPILVKAQIMKAAIESACMILRVDEIVSGQSNPSKQQQQPSSEDVDTAE